MANGDILIHNGLYGSAEQADGTYDFKPSLSMPKTGFQVQIWQLVTTREQSVQIIR